MGVDDEAWVALWHGAVPARCGSLPTIPELGDTDPRSAGFENRVQGIAEARELDIWVLGPLRSEAVAITGRGVGVIEVASVIGSPEYSALGWTRSQPQTIALLYAVGEVPGGAPNALDRTWRAWRIVLGNHFRLFVVIAVVLVFVTLAGTVVALIADRRAAVRGPWRRGTRTVAPRRA
ncbi:MAG: hypothetical protein AAGU73_04415 [Actinomycetota bacterium]